MVEGVEGVTVGAELLANDLPTTADLCTEECLRRIAARLCRLDECGRNNVTGAIVSDGTASPPPVGGNSQADSCDGRDESIENCCAPSPTTCGEKLVNCCNVEKHDPADKGEVCIATAETGGIAGKLEYDLCAPLSNTENDSCPDERQSGNRCSAASGNAVSYADAMGQAGNNCCVVDNKGGGCSTAGQKKDDHCSEDTTNLGAENGKGDCCTKQRNNCGNEVPTASKTEVTSANASCADQCCSMQSPQETETSSIVCDPECHNDEGNNGNAGSEGDCVDDCCKLLPRAPTAGTPATCSDHLRIAFAKYEGLLTRGQCLCRSVLDQLGFCCCSVTPDGLVAKESACVGPAKVDTTTGVRKLSEDIDIEIICSSDRASATKDVARATTRVNEPDVEKSAAREHVVVSASGMTCTGCSRQMMNVLDSIPGVSHGKVTFISAMAEFDVDKSIAQPEDVLRRIEKETGFKCSQLVSGFHHLHVLMSPTVAQKFEDACVPGVESITKDTKTTYRIAYDPRIIGARALIAPDVQLAPPVNDTGIAESTRRLWNMTWKTVAAAVFTIPVVVLNWSNISVPNLTSSIVSLVLATVVQSIAVPEFYVGAIKSLVYSRIIEMDMLVVISITAAYGYSIIAFALAQTGHHLKQEAFFETGALLITLVVLGRLMAAWARARAVSSVSVRSLQAETALLLQANGETSKLDARLLQYGDAIMIPPHCRIVTDAKVLSGEGVVDESMITGESNPILKQKGDLVVAGTVNGPGTLQARLIRLPGENSVSDIAKLVDDALVSRPPIQELADKVASWFTPAVLALAISAFAIWIAIALKVRDSNGGEAVGTAITYAIAVLAISCPCALGLAVPMVLVIAGGVAARVGVVIKAADAIERGFKVTDVVFDKTGTLTKGDLEVAFDKFFCTTIREDEALALAKSLTQGNEHPVSVAVASHLGERPLPMLGVEKTQSISGAGIQGLWKGAIIKGGNPYWLGLEDHREIAPLLNQGMTYFCVTLDGKPLLAFGLGNTLRDEAATVVAELRRRRINCHIVSGDSPKVVSDVARSLNIDQANALGRQLPAEKQKYVHSLQSQGKVVLFCGDGTNDAVAVTQANVGVQIGSASDVTNAVADVALLGGLDGVVMLLDISRKAFRRIQFNFVWSAVYNIFAILLAAGAFVKFRIPPGYAGLGEIVSVGPVILVAATMALGRKA